MSIMARLNEISCMVFDDYSIELTPAPTANDADGRDSLSHVNLITAIGNAFKTGSGQKELFRQRDAGDLLAGPEQKLAA